MAREDAWPAALSPVTVVAGGGQALQLGSRDGLEGDEAWTVARFATASWRRGLSACVWSLPTHGWTKGMEDWPTILPEILRCG